MTKQSTPSSRSTRLRRLVEEYTPDGTLGRLGLAAVTGSVGGFLLWASLVGLVAGTAVSAVVLTPPAAIGFIICMVMTIITLWPVYLSTIGRIESPADYATKLRNRSSPSPTEQLKDEYQKGKLSEDDLERELEAVLDGSDRPRAKNDHDQHSQTGRQRKELQHNN